MKLSVSVEGLIALKNLSNDSLMPNKSKSPEKINPIARSKLFMRKGSMPLMSTQDSRYGKPSEVVKPTFQQLQTSIKELGKIRNEPFVKQRLKDVSKTIALHSELLKHKRVVDGMIKSNNSRKGRKHYFLSLLSEESHILDIKKQKNNIRFVDNFSKEIKQIVDLKFLTNANKLLKHERSRIMHRLKTIIKNKDDNPARTDALPIFRSFDKFEDQARNIFTRDLDDKKRGLHPGSFYERLEPIDTHAYFEGIRHKKKIPNKLSIRGKNNEEKKSQKFSSSLNNDLLLEKFSRYASNYKQRKHKYR